MLSFWGFLILLFPICFFHHFAYTIYIEYQYITNNLQDFKNKIMKNVSAFVLLRSRATLSFIL